MCRSYYRGIMKEQVSVTEKGRVCACVCVCVQGSREAACRSDITAAVLSGLIQNAHTWLTSDSGSHQTLAQSGNLYRRLLGSFQRSALWKSKTGPTLGVGFFKMQKSGLFSHFVPSQTGTGHIWSCRLNITGTDLLREATFCLKQHSALLAVAACSHISAY